MEASYKLLRLEHWSALKLCNQRCLKSIALKLQIEIEF